MPRKQSLYTRLNLLTKNRQFLSTHGRIKNFNIHIDLMDMVRIENIKIPSKITSNNLKLISELFNCEWLYCVPYAASERKGYFFYGILPNDKIINYHRKETSSPMAGTTMMHVDNYAIQINKLLNFNSNISERDIKALIKLNEIVDNKHIEKLIWNYI